LHCSALPHISAPPSTPLLSFCLQGGNLRPAQPPETRTPLSPRSLAPYSSIQDGVLSMSEPRLSSRPPELILDLCTTSGDIVPSVASPQHMRSMICFACLFLDSQAPSLQTFFLPFHLPFHPDAVCPFSSTFCYGWFSPPNLPFPTCYESQFPSEFPASKRMWRLFSI